MEDKNAKYLDIERIGDTADDNPDSIENKGVWVRIIISIKIVYTYENINLN